MGPVGRVNSLFVSSFEMKTVVKTYLAFFVRTSPEQPFPKRLPHRLKI
jgi:hypothetical protein